MTLPREALLTAFFHELEAGEVPYCVQRNYQNLYRDTVSDIDIIVEPERVVETRDCLRRAAEATGHQAVLSARYVNFSYVYWHPNGGFIRLDVDTEVRWRVFPILSAKAVVTLRRSHGAFFIPHPRHESVVLLTAAIWRGHLSERYEEQLAHLFRQIGDPQALERTFRAGFGQVADRLVECQARVLEQPANPHLWRAARWSLVRHAFGDAPNRRAFFHYVAKDARRLFKRLRRPPGISLLYASNAHPGRDMNEFFERLRFLYPVEKSTTRAVRVPPESGAHVGRLGFGLRLRRLYALLKGGLFVRLYELHDNRDIHRILHTQARYLYPARTFIWGEADGLQTWLGHVETGFMAELAPSAGGQASTDAVVRFVASVLEQGRQSAAPGPRRCGAFVVLLGLDGSGKTTVARQLCCLGPHQSRFDRIRYFHWQPRLNRDTNFPLPEPGNQPRKPEQRRSLVQSALSAGRLLKNLALANLAYRWRVRPLLRRNSLVLVDRYFYNYFLDPVSVRYYGPARLLQWASRWFPRPDLLVVLKAVPEVLLSRKQELTREEILRQTKLLDQLSLDADAALVLDATQPPVQLAQAIHDKASAVAERADSRG